MSFGRRDRYARFDDASQLSSFLQGRRYVASKGGSIFGADSAAVGSTRTVLARHPLLNSLYSTLARDLLRVALQQANLERLTYRSPPTVSSRKLRLFEPKERHIQDGMLPGYPQWQDAAGGVR